MIVWAPMPSNGGGEVHCQDSDRPVTLCLRIGSYEGNCSFVDPILWEFSGFEQGFFAGNLVCLACMRLWCDHVAGRNPDKIAAWYTEHTKGIEVPEP